MWKTTVMEGFTLAREVECHLKVEVFFLSYINHDAGLGEDCYAPCTSTRVCPATECSRIPQCYSVRCQMCLQCNQPKHKLRTTATPVMGSNTLCDRDNSASSTPKSRFELTDYIGRRMADAYVPVLL